MDRLFRPWLIDLAADRQEFIDYCLNPAIEMRSAIYKQLCIIDAKEYDVPSKRIPEIVCK